MCVGLPTLPGPCNGLGRSVLTGALQGMNAHFVLRIATDRDWAADVRAQVRPSKNRLLSSILLSCFAFLTLIVDS